MPASMPVERTDLLAANYMEVSAPRNYVCV